MAWAKIDSESECEFLLDLDHVIAAKFWPNADEVQKAFAFVAGLVEAGPVTDPDSLRKLQLKFGAGMQAFARPVSAVGAPRRAR
jgi:hypothetical protein